MNTEMNVPKEFPMSMFEMMERNLKQLEDHKAKILTSFFLNFDRDFEKKVKQQGGKMPVQLFISSDLEQYKDAFNWMIPTFINKWMPEKTMMATWLPSIDEVNINDQIKNQPQPFY